MAEAQVTRYPEYVTDGSHIYLWNDEYAAMLADGRLKESGPPAPPVAKEPSAREKTKIEQLRKKALEDAQNAVKVLSASGSDLGSLFGAEPKDEGKK